MPNLLSRRLIRRGQEVEYVTPPINHWTERAANTDFKGFIDRMRFSNQPLTPDQFLFRELPAIPTVITNKNNCSEPIDPSVNFTIANYSYVYGPVYVERRYD